ncbi:hypothetical protein BURKHO8Y_140258 [Burkholderia sp. 8Y]|nr:hypothetical protein BURKHO8Y_140258 [Burkholderia sp. 8Y]
MPFAGRTRRGHRREGATQRLGRSAETYDSSVSGVSSGPAALTGRGWPQPSGPTGSGFVSKKCRHPCHCVMFSCRC